MEELLRIVSETEAANEPDMIEALKSRGYDENAIKAVATAARVLSAYSDDIDVEGFQELAKSLGFAEEKVSEEKITKSDLERLDPVARRKVAELLKAREQDEERMTALEDRIGKAENAERLSLFKSQVEEIVLPDVNNDELAESLKSLGDAAGDEIADKLSKALTAISNAYKSSEVFKEIGSGADGGADDDPYTKLESIANEIVKNDNVSFGVALDTAFERNQELAASYLEKQRRI
jgi:hypothetical protein